MQHDFHMAHDHHADSAMHQYMHLIKGKPTTKTAPQVAAALDLLLCGTTLIS